MIAPALLFAGCAAPHPPDLILISLDTTRADQIGAYGNVAGLTPNLDRFAAEAVTFTHAYSQATFTAPSHASVFTSRYPPELVRTGRHPIVGGDKPTLAEVLTAYGYDTAAFVAGGDLAPEIGLGVGFASYSSPQNFGSFFHTVRPAVRWLDDHDPSRPYFVFIHTYDTHSPYLKPPPLGTSLLDATHTGPGVDALHTQTQRLIDGWLVDDMGPFLQMQTRHVRPRSTRSRQELGRMIAASVPPPVRLTDRDVQDVRDAYDGALAYGDTWFGLLMADLDARGVLDHAVVVVFGDHGEALGERGIFGHSCEVDDATAHVPLLVRMPGGERGGTRIDGLVELVDIMPTLLELAGGTVPAGARGVSLGPALRGEPFAGREVAITTGSEGMRETSARGAAGRLTYMGLPAWMPEAADVMAASGLPGPSFESETLDAAGQAHARDLLVAFVRSIVPLPADPKDKETEALRRELRAHGYWDGGG